MEAAHQPDEQDERQVGAAALPEMCAGLSIHKTAHVMATADTPLEVSARRRDRNRWRKGVLIRNVFVPAPRFQGGGDVPLWGARLHF
jgi:hypothetical protein